MLLAWLLAACSTEGATLHAPTDGRGTGSSLHTLHTPHGPVYRFNGIDCSLEGIGARPDVSCVEAWPDEGVRATIRWTWAGDRYDTALAPWLALDAPERDLLQPEAWQPPCEDLAPPPGCRVLRVPASVLAMSVRTAGGWSEGPEARPVLRPPESRERVLRGFRAHGKGWVELDGGGWLTEACAVCAP